MAGKPKGGGEEPRALWENLIRLFDRRSQVLVLLILVTDGVFGVAVATRLGSSDLIWGLAIFAALIAVEFVCVTVFELAGRRSGSEHPLDTSSGAQPDRSQAVHRAIDRAIGELIESYGLAVGLPQPQDDAKFGVFVFRHRENQLVCEYDWPAGRPEGKDVRFDLTRADDDKVVVVRAFRKATAVGARVRQLPKNSGGVSGNISTSIQYVLASPIRTTNGMLWGTVDIDASSDQAQAVLESNMALRSINLLARHLGAIVSVGPAATAER